MLFSLFYVIFLLVFCVVSKLCKLFKTKQTSNRPVKLKCTAKTHKFDNINDKKSTDILNLTSYQPNWFHLFNAAQVILLHSFALCKNTYTINDSKLSLTYFIFTIITRWVERSCASFWVVIHKCINFGNN